MTNKILFCTGIEGAGSTLIHRPQPNSNCLRYGGFSGQAKLHIRERFVFDPLNRPAVASRHDPVIRTLYGQSPPSMGMVDLPLRLTPRACKAIRRLSINSSLHLFAMRLAYCAFRRKVEHRRLSLAKPGVERLLWLRFGCR
jgi:hypothetical protein